MSDRLNNDELVKQLRYCANSEPICEATCICPYYDRTEEETHDYRCVERMMERAADAIEELSQKAQQLPCWIPVSERLPENNEDVLVTDGEYCAVGYYRPDAQAWDSDIFGWLENRTPVDDDIVLGIGTVTHWMPLPELPKEEKEMKEISEMEMAYGEYFND